MDSRYRDHSSDLLPPPSNGLPWTFSGMCTWVASHRLWAAERYVARKMVIRATHIDGYRVPMDSNGKSVLVSKVARNERKVVAYSCARLVEMLNGGVSVYEAMENIRDEVALIAQGSEQWNGALEFLATIPTTPWQSRTAGMKVAALVMMHDFLAQVLVDISSGVWGIYYAYFLFVTIFFIGTTAVSASWLIATILVPWLLKFLHAGLVLLDWVLNIWGGLYQPTLKAFLNAYHTTSDTFLLWTSSVIGWFNIGGFYTPMKSISERTPSFDEFVFHTSNATMHIANASFNLLPLSLFLRTSSYSIFHAIRALDDWNSTDKWDLDEGLRALEQPIDDLSYTLQSVETSIPFIFQSYRGDLDRVVFDIEALIAAIHNVPSTVSSQIILASYAIWALSFPFVWRYPVPFCPESYRLNNLLNYLSWTVFSDQLGCLGSDRLFSLSYLQPSSTKPSGSPRFGCAPIQTIAAGMGYMTPEDYYHHICRSKQAIDQRMVIMTKFIGPQVDEAIKKIVDAIKETKALDDNAQSVTKIWRKTTLGLEEKIAVAIAAMHSSGNGTYWTGWFKGKATDEKEAVLRELYRWKMDQDELGKIGIWVGQAAQGLSDILLILRDISDALNQLHHSRKAFGEPSNAQVDEESKESRKFSREWKVLAAEVLNEVNHLGRMWKGVKVNQARVRHSYDEYLKDRKEELNKRDALELGCRRKGRTKLKVYMNPDEAACLMDGLGAFSLRTGIATTILDSQETEATGPS